MALAKIQSLVDRRDNSEIVRDEIGAILLVESESQQALAAAAGKDPELWRLRVFLERSAPWEFFDDSTPTDDDLSSTPPDVAPIVNVTFDRATYDMRKSDVVHRQHANGTFHIDCYGYGQAVATADGHLPGDKAARVEAQRAARLVRAFLMSSTNTYLGLSGLVGRRWLESIQILAPQANEAAAERIVCARLTLLVDFNEFSPQYEAEPLELISVGVFRKETGELYFTSDFSYASAS